MRTQSISIPTSSQLNLSARLDLPDSVPTVTVLFAHCYTCGKDALAASRISKNLAEHGLAVLRFDFTGLGESEGEFEDTNFSSNVQDLIEAAHWLEQHYETPSLLIGHSLGGTAILAAAHQLPKAKAFVTIGSPSDPKHIFKLMGHENIEMIERNGDAEVILGRRTFKIKKQFLVDAAQQRVLHVVRSLDRPLLIMHSPVDETVHVDHATILFQAAAHPKSFVSLGDANHLIASQDDANFIADIIAAWSRKYTNKNSV